MDERGIPAAGADFFGELAFNNDKQWWTANKARYEADVRAPLQALCDDLAGEFGAAKLFRPFRDVRFSADKRPYKDHQGAVIATAAGAGYYLQLSAEGLMTGAGWHDPAPELVARYRAAVDDDSAGRQLAGIVESLLASGYEVRGDELKTAPRGFSADHPRIAFLRRKSLFASRDHGTPPWMSTATVVDHVRADWRGCAALIDWLTRHLAA